MVQLVVMIRDWGGLRLIATVCYSIKHQTLPFFHYESPRYKPIQKLIGIHPSRLSLWALVKLQDRLNTVYILSINDCPSKMILGAGDVTGTSFPSKTKTYQYWCSQNLDPIHCWHVLTDFFCRVLGTWTPIQRWNWNPALWPGDWVLIMTTGDPVEKSLVIFFPEFWLNDRRRLCACTVFSAKSGSHLIRTIARIDKINLPRRWARRQG